MKQLSEEFELQMEYKQRILNDFPTFLKADVDKVISVMPLTQEIMYIFFWEAT